MTITVTMLSNAKYQGSDLLAGTSQTLPDNVAQDLINTGKAKRTSALPAVKQSIALTQQPDASGATPDDLAAALASAGLAVPLLWVLDTSFNPIAGAAALTTTNPGNGPGWKTFLKRSANKNQRLMFHGDSIPQTLGGNGSTYSSEQSNRRGFPRVVTRALNAAMGLPDRNGQLIPGNAVQGSYTLDNVSFSGTSGTDYDASLQNFGPSFSNSEGNSLGSVYLKTTLGVATYTLTDCDTVDFVLLNTSNSGSGGAFTANAAQVALNGGGYVDYTPPGAGSGVGYTWDLTVTGLGYSGKVSAAIRTKVNAANNVLQYVIARSGPNGVIPLRATIAGGTMKCVFQGTVTGVARGQISLINHSDANIIVLDYINDYANSKTPAQVAGDIGSFLAQLRAIDPNRPVHIFDGYPSSSVPAANLAAYMAAVAPLATTYQCLYTDLRPALVSSAAMNAAGMYTASTGANNEGLISTISDQLHPSWYPGHAVLGQLMAQQILQNVF